MCSCDCEKCAERIDDLELALEESEAVGDCRRCNTRTTLTSTGYCGRNCELGYYPQLVL
jgi:hypothetical protein